MKHLFKIGQNYYYRRRTPILLFEMLGRVFVKLSLHTKKKEHADLQRLKLDNLFEELVLGLRLRLVEPQHAIEQLKQAGVFADKENRLLLVKSAKKFVVGEASKKNALEPVSKLFQQYKQERLATKRWIDKTALENQRCFGLLLTAAGDHRPDHYTHQMLLDFCNILQKLPPNVNTNPRTRGKSLPAILKMGHSHFLSLSQVNKYMVCISAFFSWLHQHEMLSQNNPAHHLLLSRAKLRPDEERLAFTIEEIQKMLKELLTQKEGFGTHQCRFWVPTIAAFSGARLSEICGLYLEDIYQQDGVWCFDINEKHDKRVKTFSSVRVIPMHPSLIFAGLLEYVESMRIAGHDRLFPDLHLEKYHGYGRAMSKWFSHFNRQYLSSNPKLVFHSIRHSFAMNMRDKHVEKEVIMQLLGHHNEGVTNRYCKRVKINVLLAAINQLPWK